MLLQTVGVRAPLSGLTLSFVCTFSLGKRHSNYLSYDLFSENSFEAELERTLRTVALHFKFL